MGVSVSASVDEICDLDLADLDVELLVRNIVISVMSTSILLMFIAFFHHTHSIQEFERLLNLTLMRNLSKTTSIDGFAFVHRSIGDEESSDVSSCERKIS